MNNTLNLPNMHDPIYPFVIEAASSPDAPSGAVIWRLVNAWTDVCLYSSFRYDEVARQAQAVKAQWDKQIAPRLPADSPDLSAPRFTSVGAGFAAFDTLTFLNAATTVVAIAVLVYKVLS